MNDVININNMYTNIKLEWACSSVYPEGSSLRRVVLRGGW